MFGADTALVFEAMQVAGIAAIVGGGAIWLLLRRRAGGTTTGDPVADASAPDTGLDIESRVRVLERIATDRSADLADEIEALRAPVSQTQSGGEAR